MDLDLGPLHVTTRHEDCYNVLKAAILDLKFPPGMPLREGDIAAQLGISKTPVREALAKLSGEGFITTSPGAQSYVAGLSAESVRDSYEVRILLECASIRQVVNSFDGTELDELSECVSDAERALRRVDWAGLAAANDRFHSLLIQKNPNQRLQAIMSQLFDHVRRVRSALYQIEQEIYDDQFSRDGVKNHRSILDAVKARDGERAAELIESDIQQFMVAMATPMLAMALEKLNYRS